MASDLALEIFVDVSCMRLLSTKLHPHRRIGAPLLT